MNFKVFLLAFFLFILSGIMVTSTELVFVENYCIVGQDCTLNDLFLTGNFSFLGDIINVTILNQNIIGQLTIEGSLVTVGNVTADFFIGDGSLLSNIPNSSLWNRSGTNTFLRNIGDNVSIGHTNPGAKLVVWDSKDVTSTGGGALRIGGSDTKFIAIDNNEIQAIADGTAGTLFLNDDGGTVSVHSVTDGVFDVNTQDFYITVAGNVGVNDTTPDATLEVVGNFMVSDTTNDDGNFFIVNSAGNVGIGTTNPSELLSVNGDAIIGAPSRQATTFPGLEINTTDRNAGLTLANDSNHAAYITFENDGAFHIKTHAGNNPLSLMNDGGNVGIGTTTPSDALEVVGNVRVSGSLNASKINASAIKVGTNDVQTVNAIWNFANNDSLVLDNSTIIRTDNLTILGFLQNNTDANLTTLTVKNITSPHANKSYIFFESDGSVGIMLDPVIPSVSAQKEIQNVETKEYTRGTERTCKDGICSLVIHSGTRFVQEDGIWKDIKEAKSLKNSGIQCNVYKDNPTDPTVQCVDWNYTNIKLRIQPTKTGITPIRITFKNGTERSKTDYNFDRIDIFTEVSLTRENIIGHIIKVGDASTTISLNDTTTNLEDTWINKDQANNNQDEVAGILIDKCGVCNRIRTIWMIWNISGVPNDQVIDKATFYAWQFTANSVDGSEILGIQNSSSQDWDETVLTWNNQPTDGGYQHFGSVQTGINKYVNYTMTEMIAAYYNGGMKNISIRINVSSANSDFDIRWNDREDTHADGNLPFLNITYSAAGPTPDTTPPTFSTTSINNTSQLEGEVIQIGNNVSDISNVSMVIFAWNDTGTWRNISNTSFLTEYANINFTVNVTLTAGEGVVGVRFYANDTLGNAGSSTIRTFGAEGQPGPKSPRFFIQDLTNGLLFYVNNLGNSWLKGNLNITKNLTVDTDTLFVDSENNRVGIGNTIPNATLHVSGDINASGTITAGNGSIMLDGVNKILKIGNTKIQRVADDIIINPPKDVKLIINTSMNVTENFTVNGVIFLPEVIQIPPQGTSKIIINDDSGIVGVKIGVFNTIADASDESGVSYIWSVDGTGNNVTVDLHSSLDTKNPLTMVNHYNNDIKGHVYRLNADNTNAFFAWEVGKENRVVTINKTGEITFNNSVTIDKDGSVGIGTTNPSILFHINGGDASLLRIDGDSQAGIQEFYDGVTAKGFIGYGNAGNIFSNALSQSFAIRAENALHLGTSGDNIRMTINLAGNVGIGITNPNATLQVNGSIASDGSLYARDDLDTLTLPQGIVRKKYTHSSSSAPLTELEMKDFFVNLTMFGTFTDISVVSNISFSLNSEDNFAYEYVGYLYANVSAVYEFNTNSDDSTDIHIDGILVADYYGAHAASNAGNTGSVYLEKGYHAFVYRFIEIAGGETAFLEWKAPGSSSFDNITSSFFYYNPVDFIVADASGNIGIGATLPYNTLTIVGSVGISGSLNASSINVTGNVYLATESGNVGIGTTSPDSTLHVHTGSAGSVTAPSDADDLVIEHNIGGGITILTPDNGDGTIYFGSPGDSIGSKISWKLDNDLLTIGTHNIGAEIQLMSDTNNEAMRIDSNQNVGIGIISPTERLVVAGNANVTGNLIVGADGSGKVGIRVTTPTIDLNIGDDDTGFNQSADGVLDFQSDNNKVAGLARDGANGRFFVYLVDNSAADDPACRQDSGEITRGSAGCTTSSIRYKQNVQDLNYGLEEIMQLRPVSFQRKTDPDRIRFGMIAEDVAEIFPEIIGYEPYDPTLIQTYDKRDMQAVLIKAIQEQQVQIDELKQELKSNNLKCATVS